jgi:hypothetical protein
MAKKEDMRLLTSAIESKFYSLLFKTQMQILILNITWWKVEFFCQFLIKMK